MKTCVIFNPTARGEKAKSFKKHLDRIATDCALKPTTGPDDARTLAAEAVRNGFTTVVAAGGDGTLNEVLNGMGDVPGGFEQARLGVLPLGTINVFAKEHGLPTGLAAAWEVIRQGREQTIDLGVAEWSTGCKTERRFFAQLAGAGLDARAVELVNWELKKKIGPLAYVWAGFQAVSERQTQITVRADGRTVSGEAVLIGNGRYYGGKFVFFPGASPRDGLLDICIFHQASLMGLASGSLSALSGRLATSGAVTLLRATAFEVDAPTPIPLELEGDYLGPARHLQFHTILSRLRMVTP